MSSEFEDLYSDAFALQLTEADARARLASDLAVVLELAPAQLDGVLEFTERLGLARTDRQTQDLIRRAVHGGISLSRLDAAHRFVKFFVGRFGRDEPRDDPKILLEDMLTLGIAKQGDSPACASILERLSERSVKSRAEGRRRASRRGLLPSLVGMGTTVELRGVFARDLRLGESATELEADTIPVEVEPSISVKLVVSTSVGEEGLSFQADPELIRYLRGIHLTGVGVV